MADRTTESTAGSSAIFQALRWTAHTILLTVGSTLILFAWQPELIADHAGALIALCGIGLTIPFFYYASRGKCDPRLVLGAILLLMALTSVLIYSTHGADSPFFIVYALLVILVSVLYMPSVTLLFAALSVLSYLGTVVFYNRWNEPQALVPAGVFVRAIILFSSGWVVAQLARYRAALEAEGRRRQKLLEELERAYAGLAAQNTTIEAQAASLGRLNQELQASLAQLKEQQEELEASKAELGILFDFVRTMSAGDNLEFVINYALLQLTQMFPASLFTVRLFDPATSHLVTYATWGDAPRPDSCLREGATCSHEQCVAARTGELFILSDRTTDPLCPCTADDTIIQSYVCAPLTPAGRIEGVILMASTSPNAFNVAQIRLFQVIVNQTAMAIQRSLLFEQIQKMAIQDPLTQVYNHGYFYQRLEEEIQRARRTQAPLALITFDVDNFKAFNDTFGHRAGDHLLRQVAQIVRGNIRSMDTVARTGGEEFAVILPGTDLKGAMVVGEKLRSLIETLDHECRLKNSPPLTISVGVATCPEDASDSETLVHQADTRMYEAKRSGKNRVAGPSPKQPQLPLQ